MDEVRLAASAAARDRLAEWIDRFLRGDGKNVPFADGLLHAPRWYHGPVPVAFADLTRICGPEEGMPYPEREDHWRAQIEGMCASIRAGWVPPPLICEAERLLVNDGNHRLTALGECGFDAYPTVFWASSESAFADVQRRYPRA